VHTPAQEFGGKHASEGTPDEAWLAKCGEHGWVALARDTKILERAEELAALKKAKIHIFYYPGQATRAQLLAAAAETLADVCTVASQQGGGAWRVRGGGHPRVEPIPF
jgi:hypothetical protein